MLFRSGTTFNQKQLDTLKLVKEIALEYKDKRGESFENTAMAICLTESSCGMNKIGDLGKKPNITDASLGVMQVRVETLKYVAKKLKWNDILALDDVALASKLLNDDEFNIKVAVNYLVILSNSTNSYFKTVSRYNGGNKNYAYYNRVKKNMIKVKNIEY